MALGQQAAASAAASDSTTVDWASLNEDMVRLIAGRVLAGDVTDYLRFGAVCAHWWSSTECPRGRRPQCRRPALPSAALDAAAPRPWPAPRPPQAPLLQPRHGRLCPCPPPAFPGVDGLLLLHPDQYMAVRRLRPLIGDIVDLPSLRPQVAALFTWERDAC